MGYGGRKTPLLYYLPKVMYLYESKVYIGINMDLPILTYVINKDIFGEPGP